MKKEELEALGVNFENMQPFGELNIIVQQLPISRSDIEEGEEYEALPDVYHPRKNRVWSCGERGDGYPLETKEDQMKYVERLRDSAERHKIMAILLTQQAKELEETGEIKTSCYYPEEDDHFENWLKKQKEKVENEKNIVD